MRLRASFGRGQRSAKRRLLVRSSRAPIDDPLTAREYHDALLFIAAHPDEPAILRRVERELHRIERAVRAMPSGLARRLENSGIAGSRVVSPFSLDITRWLSARFGRHIVLDWDDEDGSEEFDDFLNHLATSVERDGLLCERLSTREWVRLAAGRGRTDLAWLIGRFDAMAASAEIRAHAFDTLDPAARWTLRGRRSSRTFARFPRRSTYWQADDFQRHPDAATVLARTVPAVRALPVAKARSLLDTCRAALCVRRREIDTLTYANEREVYLFRLEHGIDVAVFGMSPARRLPIESYFGYVVSRNRVPIGYGGGWMFLGRCEIGVNIFDEFRSGESALAFAQVLRVYRRHFRAAYFTVDPFQLGAGNTEAIRSGAFWFYYRLGFRPVDRKSASLAEEEHRRLSLGRGYRSPPGALRRLARSRLRLDVYASRKGGDHVPEIIDIGVAVTRWIGKRFAGDRRAAEAWSARRAAEVLGAGSLAHWPDEERAAFERLSPLVAMVQALALWPRRDRQSLVRLMRAKGGLGERSYVLRMQSHAGFREKLAEIAAAGSRIGKKITP